MDSIAWSQFAPAHRTPKTPAREDAPAGERLGESAIHHAENSRDPYPPPEETGHQTGNLTPPSSTPRK
jgi:hypothetical protein